MFDEKMGGYLSGSSFHNAAKLSFSDCYLKSDGASYRDDFLLHLAKGCKILHLGFVDHLPLIDEKINSGNWLHGNLLEVSELCYGIDINREGIEYLKDKHQIPDILVFDVLSNSLPQKIQNIQFDYLLIPDVIEHISDPVTFLKAIKMQFTNVDKIIITTPNAFRWNNFRFNFKSFEMINSDHRFWFTPYTISKIISDADLSVSGLGFFEHGKLSRRQVIKKMFFKRFPGFRDTLIVEIRL